MISVRIGEAERELGNVSESWVNQQINRRREDGISVCVEVIIKEGEFDMRLATPTCVSRGGGSRVPRQSEEKVFTLWRKRGLNDTDFTGGNLNAFLKQLKRIV